MINDWMIIVAFFTPPAALAVWFAIALVNFIKTPKQEVEKRKTRKVLLVISAVMLGLMLAAIITLAILFAIAITHM